MDILEPVLKLICDALGFGQLRMDADRVGQYKAYLKRYPISGDEASNKTIEYFFTYYFLKKASRAMHAQVGRFHGLALPKSREQQRLKIFRHVASGECITAPSTLDGCAAVVGQVDNGSETPTAASASALVAAVMTSALQSEAPEEFAGTLLSLYGVHLGPNAALDDMRNEMRRIEATATELTFNIQQQSAAEQMRRYRAALANVDASWPQGPSNERKVALIENFRRATSSEALREKPCAICGLSVPASDISEVDAASMNLDLMKPPPRTSGGFTIPSPMARHATLNECILEPRGISTNDEGCCMINICAACGVALDKDQLPRMALANSLWVGEVPPELRDLTPVEESMIARCRARCCIVKLEFDAMSEAGNAAQQRALKGNVIVFPQHPEHLPTVMPPAVDDVVQYVCVVFIGSEKPPKEWFDRVAKPLVVRGDRVRTALHWLKANNPLYRSITIDESRLAALPSDGTHLLPFHIEHLKPDARRAAAISRYDSIPDGDDEAGDGGNHEEVPFASVVVDELDNSAKYRELRAAALRHVRHNKGGYLVLPHDSNIVGEFDNPLLFPALYPTLFPYGFSGFDDSTRASSIAFHTHVRHLLSLADRRFQCHPTFLFTAFNILQRRSMLRSVAAKTRHSWFTAVASELNQVQSDVAQVVARKMATDTLYDTPLSQHEMKVMSLMKQVQSVTRLVDGSNSARLCMRNEARSMIISKGIPNFFVTLNPSDIYNPIVKFLAGAEIDIDRLLPGEEPNSRVQGMLVAKNPFVAAKFFNLYIKAFLKDLLGFEKVSEETMESQSHTEMGVLGVVEAFYAAVEAQGRGTLHVHMVIWIRGALHPDDLRERLLSALDNGFRDRFVKYVEDCIETGILDTSDSLVEVPSDGVHPCAVRGVDFDDPAKSTMAHREKDVANVANKCQRHQHRATCYKYHRPGEPRECRFNLRDGEAPVLESRVDPNTGEFTLKCMESMVNNYNKTIIEAVRNNMDIKLIASGETAKAITFYITDYISKTQLKSHVAYAAIETGVRKLESVEKGGDGDVGAERAKRLLQKCSYEMLSRQELSAPQVASFLMKYEDHFSSHDFRCLFWTSAENFIDQGLPSPECYPARDGIDDSDHPAFESSTRTDQPSADGTLTADDSPASDGASDSEETGEEATQTTSSDATLLDDDVILEVNDDGEISARSSQLRDYIYRGCALDDVCFWDYVSRVSKARFSKSEQAGMTRAKVTRDEAKWQGSDVLTVASKQRPVSCFKPEHDLHASVYNVVSHPVDVIIPLMIGPALPRRDRPAVRAKYCRLMLIFFKPWRTVHDLRAGYPSWQASFDAFLGSPLCAASAKQLMRNMQVFHECKDSRDEHFRQRRHRLASFGAELEGRDELQEVEMDGHQPASALEQEHAMEAFLRSCRSKAKLDARSEREDACLSIAAKCGLVENSNMGVYEAILENSVSASSSSHVNTAQTGLYLEDVWRESYEDRKLRWKPKRKPRDRDPEQDIQQQQQSHVAVERRPWMLPASPEDRELNVRIVNDAIAKWTLNEKQEFGFRIIAQHATRERPDQLRMYVAGSAGTGKSRLIDAVRDFFKVRGEEDRYVVASYMGIAAKNIEGMTLHSCLNLQGLSRMKLHGEVHQAMIKYWKDKDWLIIDEVSMISLHFLQSINKALQLAKESSEPFGGVHIVFAGDFAQLPPVGASSVYKSLKHAAFLAGTTTGQAQLDGKLLWLSVDCVIKLEKPQRQKGDGNERFVQLLDRLRLGECNDEDYNILCSRVLSPEHATLFEKDSPWRWCPIIVTDNASKDALNEACAIQFALDNDLELHWYYAVDSRLGKVIRNEELIEALQWCDSGETKQRLGRLPLCIGMPVLISQNFDVAGGVVNGTRGKVVTVRYKQNHLNQRVCTSVVVAIQTAGAPMPHLPAYHMPILADVVDVTFNNHGVEAKKIQREQVAIVPAFSMTAHRSQGQTMTHAIVDLASSINTQAAYVMASRATSLDGLLIFRAFPKSVIQRGLPEEIHVEFHRLEIVALRTIIRYGTSEQRGIAQQTLARLAKEGHSLATIGAAASLTPKEIQKNTKNYSRAGARIDKLQFAVQSSWNKGKGPGLASTTKRKAPPTTGSRKRICRMELPP